MNLTTKIFYLCFFLFLIACRSEKVQKSNTDNVQKSKEDYGNNNSVEVKDKNVKSSGGDNNKVEFEGSNNKVVFENENIDSKSKNTNDVIIVKGDSNTIVIKQNDIKARNKNTADTVIFEGEKDNINVEQGGFKDRTEDHTSTTIIRAADDDDEAAIDRYEDSVANNTKYIEIGSRTFQVQNTVKEYEKGAYGGDDYAAIKLALCYYSGTWVKKNCDSATAVLNRFQNSAEALSVLGDLYAMKLCGNNEAAGIEAYKKAAKMGHEYSATVLRKRNISFE